MTTTRREWLRWSVAGVVTAGASARLFGWTQAPMTSGTAIEIWKTPTCGCCKMWVDHMQKAGFRPTVHDLDDVSPIKRKLKVPAALQSCHTAVVGGYAIEGHVPADLVRQVLKQKPAIAGLAVPGMPMGSPGMEGPRKDPYDVVAFEQNGRATVFAKR